MHPYSGFDLGAAREFNPAYHFSGVENSGLGLWAEVLASHALAEWVAGHWRIIAMRIVRRTPAASVTALAIQAFERRFTTVGKHDALIEGTGCCCAAQIDVAVLARRCVHEWAPLIGAAAEHTRCATRG
jgi:hypothetical protein